MGTFSPHLVLNPNPKIMAKTKAQSISCTFLDMVKCSELEHDMKGDILASSLSHLKVLNWKALSNYKQSNFVNPRNQFVAQKIKRFLSLFSMVYVLKYINRSFFIV